MALGCTDLTELVFGVLGPNPVFDMLLVNVTFLVLALLLSPRLAPRLLLVKAVIDDR